jgi:hypothetical protein
LELDFIGLGVFTRENSMVLASAPPIMEHSRELQMDPEHMASHKWFKYLRSRPRLSRSGM